jgi:hypothetical protein
MIKKVYLLFLVVVLVLVAGCTSESSNEESKGKTSEEKTIDEPEVLFSYEEGENDRYKIYSVTSSYDASTVLFSTEETIKREDEKYHYVVTGNKDAIDLRDLSTSEDEKESCSQDHISPNGQYLVERCLKMDHAFMIYDLKAEEIIHEEPEFEEYGARVVGITNDAEVAVKSKDGDILSIYDIQNNKVEEYSLPELTGKDTEQFENLVISNDGQKILIDAFFRLYLLDRSSGELEEIINLDSYHEQYEKEELYLLMPKLSPDGKYAYIRISENRSDSLYVSHNFINLETGDIQSFTDFEYDNIGEIDEKGRMFLADSEELFLYSIPDNVTYRIPELDLSTYAGDFTLSGDGNYLLYSDKKGDDVKMNYLYKVALGDVNTYETEDLKAIPEVLEDMSKPGEGNTDAEALQLNEVKEDLHNMYPELWNSIANVQYPTEFPEEVKHISYQVNPERYGQTISFVSDSTKRKQMSFTAVDRTEDDHKEVCIRDDLELTETKDGVDYYFYLFNNDEGEISFAKDGWCYTIEGEDFTEEEYFNAAYSLAEAGEVPHELPIDEVVFPTKVPIQNPFISNYYIYHHAFDQSHKYIVEYRGDGENDLDIDLEINKNEPNFYDSKENETIELKNGMEGLFNEEHLRLFMFDGDYYYSVEADIGNEELAEFGLENVKNALVEVGNSVQ